MIESFFYILLVMCAIFLYFAIFYKIKNAKKDAQCALNLKEQELIYTQKLQNLELESAQRFQDLELQNEKKLKNAEVENANLSQSLQSCKQNLDSINKKLEQSTLEYESKLQNLELLLQQNTNNHKEEILKIQENYEIKLANALNEQAQKLESREKKAQENLKETLELERQMQLATLTQKFGELSKSILDEKQKHFESAQNLSLKPLQEEIARFKLEIEKNTKESSEKQVKLETEIKNLCDMSARVAKDTDNLAKALKGDNKMQGDWGEVVLERILELSGLQKNREYFTQTNLKNSDENKNLRPDMIITLPNNRAVVIDSKVSLSAYEKYVNSGDKDALSAHIESVKAHIKILQNKEYQNLLDSKKIASFSPFKSEMLGEIMESSDSKIDFVIMFMPIEGAFSLIVRENVFLESYKKGVVIASPSTLMVILRLIHKIWSNEAKDKNIVKILNECERLLKKFDGFAGNMDKLKSALDTAQGAFEKADGQLLSGKGSLGVIVNNISRYMVKIPSKESENLIEVSE